MYFRYSGGPVTPTLALALATAIYGEAVVHIVPQIQVDTVLYGVAITDLSVVGGTLAEYNAVTSGARAGNILPIQVAAIANYTIARRYRGGKPRGYWWLGSDADMVTETTWVDTSVTTFTAAINAYIAAITGLSSGGVTILEHVAVSYYDGFDEVPYGTPTKYRRQGIPRPVPVVDDIVSVAVNPNLGSQRRRRGRV